MLALVDSLRQNDVDLTFAAPAHGPLAEELQRRGIAHLPWDVFDEQSGRRKSLELIREQMRQLVSGEQPDLVHANSLSASRISGPVLRELGQPGIGHLRDIIKLNRTAVADLNRHDRLIAVSCATRDWHVRQGLAADKTFVMSNGVDTQQFRPRNSTGLLQAELGLLKDTMIALSVGQISLRKGIDVTLAALRDVADVYPNLHFVLVGERSSTKDESVRNERQLLRAAEQQPLRGRVHFLGRRNDVADLMGEATLLIHAARQEPLGRVLLEAASAGLPVIATRVGGTEEIFPRESESAILIPPDDPAALAQAMRRMFNSADVRERLAIAARRRVTEQFTIEKAAQALLEHYRIVASV